MGEARCLGTVTMVRVEWGDCYVSQLKGDKCRHIKRMEEVGKKLSLSSRQRVSGLHVCQVLWTG